MKKITFLTLAVAFAFTANAQLRLNANPLNNADHLVNAGIKMDTLRTITGIPPQTDTLDVSYIWHWTPGKLGTWTPEATGVTTGARTTGMTTTVNSFYQWAGASATYANAAPAGDYLFPPQTVSTRKGFAVKIKSKDGSIQDKKNSGYSKNESGFFSLGEHMDGGGDPIWFNSLADMKTYVTSGKKVFSDRTYHKDSIDTSKNPPVPRADYGALHEGLHTKTPVSDFPDGLNTADSAFAVVINKRPGDGALGIYPGKFKEIDLRFSVRSDRQQMTRDLEFDIFTFDPGNTGKTASWNVIISLSSNNIDANNQARDNTDSLRLGDNGAVLGGFDGKGRRWKAATFTTSTTAMGDSIHFSLYAATGLQPHEWFNQTVVIALQTKGTEGATDNASGTYDPMIVIDNIKLGGWNKQLDAAAYAANGPLLPLGPGFNAVKQTQISAPKVIGKTGQIEVIDAQNVVNIYSITGQKVASFTPEVKTVYVPAGVYVVSEQNKKAVKVIVK